MFLRKRNLLQIRHVILLFFALFTPSICQSSEFSKALKVGVYDNPPKIFINNHGKADGIFIDILEAIAKKENITIEYVSGSWSDLYYMLEKGKIDVLPDMAFTKSRDSLFTFSIPVLNSWLQVFTTKRTVVNTLKDLKNKRIGVLKASMQESYIKLDIKSDLDNYSVTSYDSYSESVKALKSGKIDVIIANRFFIFSDLFDDDIVATGIILQLSELHYAFSKKTNMHTVRLFDKHLSALKNNPNSLYYKSLQKWFNRNKFIIPEYIKWLIVLLIVVLLFVLTFTITLNKKVKERTKSLNLKNEELLRAKLKAEESNRLKTVFLQNMSHEIRTPMNGILGFINLLKDIDLNDEKRLLFIDLINKSGERLLSTINDIIEMSKIESKMVEKSITEVNITEVLNYYTKFFEIEANKKNISLRISQTITEENLTIETDKILLDSILTNLINNAIKFTNKGSIEVGSYLEGSTIVVFVKDTGIGIPADRIDAIFERFVYADMNLTRPKEGSGLGLAIVKAYIEMLDGTIWVESEIDKGSTFYFAIPHNRIV